MNVVGLLLAHGAFPCRLVAILRAVVMANEDAVVVRVVEDRHDAVVKLAGIAAGEIGPRRAGIGLHQRVMGKYRVAHDIGDRAQRMARRQHHLDVEVADPEAVAIGKEPVEVGVDGEGVRHVVDLAPERSDLPRLLADRHRRARSLLQPGRRHEVIGVGVRIEDPFQFEPLPLDVVQRPLGMVERGGERSRIELLDDVDERAFLRLFVDADILAATGIGLVKADDARAAGAARR